MMQGHEKEALFLAEIDRLIAPYRILHGLGGGGVGDVYLAESLSSNPPRLAVKALKEDVKDPLLVQRFRLEFDLLNRMEHPSIARVFEYFHASRPFFTLEYLEGEDLKSAYDVRQFGFKESRLFEWLIPLVFQVLDALRYLHQHKIIHRDLKPQNIMLLSDGAVKILDFGIARDQESRLKLTQHHEILGTFEYIAPEILMGKNYDHRIDLYSVGAFLYQFVSRKRMFEVHTLVDMFREKTTSESPELSPGQWPGYEWFITFINRLNRRVPDQRFISAGEALAWLKEFRSESDLVSDVTLSSVASPMLTIRAAPLVEREALVAELESFLDTLLDEPFFIHGPSGTGKTRCCQMVEMEAVRRQVNTLTIDCSRFVSDGRSFLEFVWEQAQFQFGRDNDLLEQQEEFGDTQFYFHLHRLLKNDRLLLVLDDLHLLPKVALLQILNFFLQNLGREREILIQWLFTFNDEWRENLAIRGGNTLPELLPRCIDWQLTPLGEDGIAQLAAYLLENRPVTPEITRELLTHSAGVPYALANLLDLLLEKELLHFRSGQWVLLEEKQVARLDTFLELANKAFEDRFQAMDPMTQQVLKWMTVAGARISRQLLLSLMQVPADALDHALNELFLDQALEIQENLLTLNDPNLGKFILENVESWEIEELHRQMLQALEEEDGDADAVSHNLKLMRHANLAGDAAKIFYYSRKLGGFFFNAGMYEEAQQYLACAISSYQGPPRTALFEAYFAKGEAELSLFRLVEAFADFKSAHDLLALIEFPGEANAENHRDMFRRVVLHRMFIVDLKRKRVADAFGHLEKVHEIHRRLAGKTFADSHLESRLTLYLPEWNEAPSPTRAATLQSHNFCRLFFDTLLEQDPRGVYVGRLAKSWSWDQAKNRLCFDLLSGKSYSNGAMLRGEDVVFSIRLAQQQADFSPLLTLPARRIADARAEGLRIEVDYHPGHAPNLAFWADLPIVPAYLYHHSPATPPGTEDKLLLGSGLYLFQGRDANGCQIKRCDAKTQALPLIHVLGKAEPVIEGLKAGRIHFAMLHQAEWLELTPKVQIQYGLVRDYVVANQLFRLCFKLGPNSLFPPRLRRALYDALPLESWNSLYFNNQMVVVRERILQMQSTVGVFKVVKRAEDKLYEALLQEGWVRNSHQQWTRKGEPFPLNLLVPEGSPMEALIESCAKRWRELGFVVKVAYKPLAEFSHYQAHPKVNCWIDSVFLDPDFEGFGDHLHSSGLQDGANLLGYQSAEMDQAIQLCEGTPILQRKAAILRLHQLFMQDLPWLPLFHPKLFYAYNVQLGGVTLTARGLFASQRQIQDLHKL